MNKNLKNYDLWKTLKSEINITKNKDLEVSDIAKLMKKDAAKLFPFLKFSCTTSNYNTIHLDLTSNPFGSKSKYHKRIYEYLSEFARQYYIFYSKFTRCKYVFYGSYYPNGEKKIPFTGDLIEITKQYNIKDREYQKQQEILAKKEMKKYEAKQKQKQIEFEKQDKIEKEQIKYIENNVKVANLSKINDMKNTRNYFIRNVQFPKLNKRCSIEEYKSQIKEGNFDLIDVVIHREIHFTDKKSLEYFSNMLMNEFEFLYNSGGNCTEDERIKYYEDYEKLFSTEEESTVKWNRIGIAIYYDNNLQYVIDTQGYNYCRYVGLVCDDTKNNRVLDTNEFNKNTDNSNENIDGQKTDIIKTNNNKLKNKTGGMPFSGKKSKSKMSDNSTTDKTAKIENNSTKSKNIETSIKEPEPKPNNEYNYRLLGRLQADCEYYLNYGNRMPKHLWAINEKEHIEKMKQLYNSFAEDQQPEWINMEDILRYEKEMLKDWIDDDKDNSLQNTLNNLIDKSTNKIKELQINGKFEDDNRYVEWLHDHIDNLKLKEIKYILQNLQFDGLKDMITEYIT